MVGILLGPPVPDELEVGVPLGLSDGVDVVGELVLGVAVTVEITGFDDVGLDVVGFVVGLDVGLDVVGFDVGLDFLGFVVGLDVVGFEVGLDVVVFV